MKKNINSNRLRNKRNTSKSVVQNSTSTNVSFSEDMKKFFFSSWAFGICSVILAMVFFVNYDEVFDKKLDLNGDNIIYYSLGKSLHEGTGYTNIIGFNESPHTHFPPGYPAFIAAGMKLNSSADYAFFKKLNGLLLGLSVLLFLWIIKRLTRSNLSVAFTATLLMAMHRELLRFSTMIMSEMLYLFLSLVLIYIAILLYERGTFKKFSWKSYLALAIFLVLIVYIYFVRTMGLSIILAFVVWFLVIGVKQLISLYHSQKINDLENINFYKQRVFYFFTLFVLTSFAMGFAKFSWDFRNESLGKSGSTYTSIFLKKEDGKTMTTIEDWTARIKSNVKKYSIRLIPQILLAQDDDSEEISFKAGALGIIILVVLFVGFINTGVLGFLLFLYLSLTFGVLLFYPEQFATTRYIIAIIPMLLFLYLNGMFNVVKFLLDKVRKPLWVKNYSFLIAALGLSVYVLFCMVPSYVYSQEGYRYYAKNSLKKVLQDVNAHNYIEAVEWCKNNLPDSSRIICRKPEIYYVYSGFRKAIGFPQYSSVDSTYNFILRNKPTHLILDNWFKHAYVTLHPAMKAYPEKFKVLHQIGELDTINHVNPAYIVQFNPEWGYFGEMLNGKREGKGVYNRQDGVRYEGEYHNDLPNGYGEYSNPNTNVHLKGIWKDGSLIDGEGVELYGSFRYEGKIKNRLPNGYGICYDSVGTIIGKGIWKNGTLVRPE